MMLKERAAAILEMAARYRWTNHASARTAKDEAVHWLHYDARKFDVGTAMLRATRELGLPLFDKGLVLAFDMLRDQVNGYRKNLKPEQRITVCQWNDTIGSESTVHTILIRLAETLR